VEIEYKVPLNEHETRLLIGLFRRVEDGQQAQGFLSGLTAAIITRAGAKVGAYELAEDGQHLVFKGPLPAPTGG
jgi:hypothetical protein